METIRRIGWFLLDILSLAIIAAVLLFCFLFLGKTIQKWEEETARNQD